MKKSLSILLSFALVFGLFASMASAADTQLTTAQKYQALVDKGVLKGNPDGDARLGNNLNRAEFATIAIAISGLEAVKPATATFSDVNSKQWWYGAIEAAAKAGLVEGYNGKFNPKNNVTVQEVIKVAVQAAGAKPVEDAKVEGAADWAGPYVQAALDAGLIASGLDYKADATRGQAIDVGYAVYSKLNPPVVDKVTVEAKAAGIKKVEVSLGKEVDTTKAVLTLKRGSSTIAVDTKWADDKKSATLTLKDSKISAATYSVTLTGLDEADVAKATSEFTAEDETVKELAFVTSSDEIAASKKAKVRISAENQYGEQASFSASNYTVNSVGLSSSLRKDSAGYLVLTIDTDTKDNTHLIPNVSQIPVYITYDATRLSAQKVFKLGNPPYAMKLELGEVKYSNGKDQLSASGETATIEMKVADQYGNPITPEQKVNINENAFILPYNDALEHQFNSDDDTYKVKVFVKGEKKVEKSDTYTLTVHAGSDSKTAAIKVGHGRVATKVKVVDVVGSVLAEGDQTQYVTLEVSDADGNLLTNQEIADNADRIKVSATGVADAKLVTVGKNKGKVKLDTIQVKKGGSVYVNVSITSMYTSPSFDYKGFKVDGVRIPDTIALTKPHAKAVLGGESEIKFVVLDQYNAEWTKNKAVGIALPNTYTIEIKMTNTNTVTTATPAGGLTLNPATDVLVNNDFTSTNKAIAIKTFGTDVGTTRFEAVLYQNKGIAGKESILDSKAATIDSIAPTSSLSYSLNDLGVMYAVYDAPAYIGLDNEAEATRMQTSNLSKSVELTVKDGAGNKVAVPKNLIKTLNTSNSNVLQVNPVPANSDVAKAIGIKAGTASVTAVVYAADGTTKHLQTTATVKNDPVTVASITSNGAAKVIAEVPAKTLADVLTAAEVVVKDQYGNEYKNAVPLAYNKLLNLSFTISDVVRASGSGTATVDAAGNFAIDAGVQGFTLNIVSADGKVVESIQID